MRIRSLKVKIVILAVSCLLLTAGMVVVYSVYFLRQRTVDDAKEQLLAIARAQAANVQAEMIAALGISGTLSNVLQEVKDADNPLDLQRYEAIDLLLGVLLKESKISGIFTCWEKKAYDYLDSGFANEEGHDASGRFAPYWQLDEQGKPFLSPLLESPHHSSVGNPERWYEVTRKTLQAQVQGPIVARGTMGKEELIAVAVTPIIADNRFVGVVGVDINLSFLQEMTDNLAVFDNQAKMSVISSDGTITASTGTLGHDEIALTRTYENAGELQQRIDAGGDEQVEVRDGLLHAFTPIHMAPQSDRSNDNVWAVAIVIPVDRVIEAPVSLMWKQIIIFAGITVVIIIAAYIGARSITQPLSTLVGGMKSIKDGDFTKELSIHSHDEIGDMADVFNMMKAKLSDSLYELQEHQEKLEEKVSQRTSELKMKNEELRNAMEEVKSTQEQLLQSEKLAVVGQMSGIVAHEVLNPVSTVSIRVETNIEKANRTVLVIDKMNELVSELESTLEGGEHLPLLSKIGVSLKKNQEEWLEDLYFLEKQTLRIVRIIDNLRQMSKTRKHLELVKLDKLVSEVLEDMGDGLKKRKINVSRNIEPVPPIIIDHTEAYSIVSNLVRNAMQSLEQQNEVPERVIEVTLGAQKDTSLELVVEDNGIGIAPEDRGSVFEPGFTSKGRKGTGFGLSFSRKVARSYHGDITLLEKEDRVGVAFKVILPLEQEKEES